MHLLVPVVEQHHLVERRGQRDRILQNAREAAYLVVVWNIVAAGACARSHAHTGQINRFGAYENEHNSIAEGFSVADPSKWRAPGQGCLDAEAHPACDQAVDEIQNLTRTLRLAGAKGIRIDGAKVA